MERFFVFVIFIFCVNILNAQITNEPPKTNKYNFKKVVPVIEMPSFDLKKLQEEDAINDKQVKPYRFGYEFDVSYDFSNSGIWEELPNGDRTWRITFFSKNAKTLNFIFDNYQLAEGATIHLYNQDRSFVLGAYTNKMNNKNKSLGTWIADGDKITIEFYEPANVKGLSKLAIGTVVHGYRSVTNYRNHLKGLNASGPCNLDVNCDVGNDFNDIKDKIKKGVALILNNGNDWCTGTLINNTSNNGAPYLLTANHCNGGEANWTFRFNWVSTNNVCASIGNSTDNGSENYFQTTSGSTILAQNSETDVELVEITGGLDESWDLEWVGWDRTGNVPPFTIGIHHPSGDIMKVCRDNNTPEYFVRSFNGNPTTELWRIKGEGAEQGWDLGVTEPGSSGSALFNPEGKIIGQLAGGFAACAGTNDNGDEDWYGRFDISWDFGNTDSTRLSNWLDPQNTGQMTLEMLSEAGDAPPPVETVTEGIVFPNPSENGKFTITNNTNNVLVYRVFDISGKLVSSGQVNSLNPEIDLSFMRSGVYFMDVDSTSKGNYVRRLVLY